MAKNEGMTKEQAEAIIHALSGVVTHTERSEFEEAHKVVAELADSLNVSLGDAGEDTSGE